MKTDLSVLFFSYVSPTLEGARGQLFTSISRMTCGLTMDFERSTKGSRGSPPPRPSFGGRIRACPSPFSGYTGLRGMRFPRPVLATEFPGKREDIPRQTDPPPPALFGGKKNRHENFRRRGCGNRKWRTDLPVPVFFSSSFAEN